MLTIRFDSTYVVDMKSVLHVFLEIPVQLMLYKEQEHFVTNKEMGVELLCNINPPQ